MNRRGFCAAALLAIAACGSWAAELAVPGQYASIQAAIDAAAPGDTVLVAAGTYEGALVFKAGIQLRGESADKVLVRSSDYTRPVLSATACAAGTISGIAFESATPATSDAWPDPCPAVVLLEQSSVEMIGCVVRNGGGCGLEAQGEGQPAITDCIFEQNGGNGICVKDKAAPQLRRNKCHDNKYAGIRFAEEASGAAEENEVWKNGSGGIYAEDTPETFQLLHNHCHDNSDAGIRLGEKARGQVIANQCRANAIGIEFDEDGEGVRLEDNVCEQNEGAGLDIHHDYALAPKNNVFWDNGGFSVGGIVLLRENEDFEALDTIAQRTRDEKRRAPEGGWQLNLFYRACAASHIQQPKERPSEKSRGLEHLLKWKEKCPESGAARIALASGYDALAWDKRGGGYASEVSSGGIREFRRYLNLGWEMLQDEGTWAAKDPEWFNTKLKLAVGLGKNDVKLADRLWATFISGQPPADDLEKAFRQGQAVDKTYYPVYENRLWSLLPRWYGSEEEVEKFVKQSADETKETCGDQFYARLIRYVAGYYLWDDMDGFFEDYSFDWPRLDAGLEQVCEVSPKSKYWLNYHCWMACAYKKRERAAYLFEKIDEEEWSSDVWNEEGRFEIYRQWAVDGKDYPIHGSELMSAVLDDDVDAVKECILDNKAEVNFMSDWGEPPVFHAADECQPEILKVLLEAKGDPEAKDVQGRPALCQAVEWGCVEAVRLLLDHGASVKTLDAQEAAPLFYAGAEDGTPEIARLLVEHGADVNQGSAKAGSPLLNAVYCGNLEVAKVLLELGADPALANAEGVTPLAEAQRLGLSEFVTLLENPNSLKRPKDAVPETQSSPSPSPSPSASPSPSPSPSPSASPSSSPSSSPSPSPPATI